MLWVCHISLRYWSIRYDFLILTPCQETLWLSWMTFSFTSIIDLNNNKKVIGDLGFEKMPFCTTVSHKKRRPSLLLCGNEFLQTTLQCSLDLACLPFCICTSTSRFILSCQSFIGVSQVVASRCQFSCSFCAVHNASIFFLNTNLPWSKERGLSFDAMDQLKSCLEDVFTEEKNTVKKEANRKEKKQCNKPVEKK